MTEFIIAGGPFMWPLLACSVLIITISIERLWFLQIRLVSPNGLTNQMVNLFNKNLKPYETVGKHIEEFDQDIYEEEHEKTNLGTYYKELKRVKPGENYLALCDGKKSNFKKNTRFWNFLLKLKEDLPSWTIAAQPGPWVGPFHWSNRRLRVPEIAAIQTFPKNYKFFGNRRSIQRQIGNAVPPLMGKAMVKYLVSNI